MKLRRAEDDQRLELALESQQIGITAHQHGGALDQSQLQKHLIVGIPHLKLAGLLE